MRCTAPIPQSLVWSNRSNWSNLACCAGAWTTRQSSRTPGPGARRAPRVRASAAAALTAAAFCIAAGGSAGGHLPCLIAARLGHRANAKQTPARRPAGGHPGPGAGPLLPAVGRVRHAAGARRRRARPGRARRRRFRKAPAAGRLNCEKGARGTYSSPRLCTCPCTISQPPLPPKWWPVNGAAPLISTLPQRPTPPR